MTGSPPPQPFPRRRFIALAATLAIVLVIVWDIRSDLAGVGIHLRNAHNYLVAPSFSPVVLGRIGAALVETIEMALLGTLIGAVLSIPCALFASDLGGPRWFTAAIRSSLAFIRSIPLIFYGYILVSVFGLGTLPGIIAMTIYTLGILSKMFLDEISNLDKSVGRSIVATGAGRFQVLWFGYLPEILPNIMTFSLLRMEINVREAAILGVVGAGGFGVLLRQYGTLPPYDKLWTLILTIFAVVVVIEIISRRLLKLMRKD